MSEAREVHSALGVANYFIRRAAATGGLDALQIMKLVYLAHGFDLAILKKPLIYEDIYAWKYGPVIRSIYSELPSGSAKIATLLGGGAVADLKGQEKNIVDQVYDKYHKLSGMTLSNLTHREDSPWHRTWKVYGQNAVIPQDDIREYFSDVLSRGTF